MGDTEQVKEKGSDDNRGMKKSEQEMRISERE